MLHKCSIHWSWTVTEYKFNPANVTLFNHVVDSAGFLLLKPYSEQSLEIELIIDPALGQFHAMHLHYAKHLTNLPMYIICPGSSACAICESYKGEQRRPIVNKPVQVFATPTEVFNKWLYNPVHMSTYQRKIISNTVSAFSRTVIKWQQSNTFCRHDERVHTMLFHRFKDCLRWGSCTYIYRKTVVILNIFCYNTLKIARK